MKNTKQTIAEKQEDIVNKETYDSLDRIVSAISLKTDIKRSIVHGDKGAILVFNDDSSLFIYKNEIGLIKATCLDK